MSIWFSSHYITLAYLSVRMQLVFVQYSSLRVFKHRPRSVCPKLKSTCSSHIVERVYDDFWTQTPVDMAEFSDLPMTHPPPEDQNCGFFPAKYFTEYFESYVDSRVYGRKSLRDRIRFNTRVKTVTKSDGKWIVECGESGPRFRVGKLIDASGMTSNPNIPKIKGQENFKGLAIHHKNFGQSTFLKDPQIQHVAVFGGAKSAADVAYASAKAGKTVSWVIREDGNGPALLFAPQGQAPYKNSNEGFYNRFLANFLPCPWAERTWLYWLMQSTWLGRWYVKRLWNFVDKANRAVMGYDREDGKERGFANLEPDTP